MKLPDPVAYFDPQERGFYWAVPIGVFAPTTVTVPPLALYLESALVAVRRAALEEAARASTSVAMGYYACAEEKFPEDAWKYEAAEECAAAIRTLIEDIKDEA